MGGYKIIPSRSGGTTTVTGTISIAGLRNGGRMTEVVLDSTSWKPLPLSPLPNRNALSIQNQSDILIKIRYEPTEPGFVGGKVNADGERFYDITDAIVIYGKAESGTPTILVEELS